MSPTILRLELLRVLRDPAGLFFTAVLPIFFYLVFGAAQSYGDQAIGDGNVRMAVMIAMAAYGAVGSAVALGGGSAVERSLGWGRQLALTPMRAGQYVATKVATTVLVVALPIGLVYLAGAATGARGTVGAWVLSALVLVLGATVFALYGLSFGMVFRSEAAVSAAGGSVVVLGFLANVFFPLSGTLLEIARWSPMYGYAALARFPLTDGVVVSQDGSSASDPLGALLANVLAWTLVLALAATLLVRRSRARQ